ncbi:MAG: GH3 auxin-responsive promoter family protein [Flavobacteriales bacterium]|nr:GH3 auxin-responsive promoter family protein [Flavobacteriales bacterium]
MKFTEIIFTWAIKRRIKAINAFKKHPHESQLKWLKQLLSTASSTEWGERFDFKSIKTVEEYKARVPLQNYETIRDDIFRTKKGEQNILWPQDIKWFAKSSGTTSDKSKFLPVSKESIKNIHKGGSDILTMYYHNSPENKLYLGKTLVIGGNTQLNKLSKDSYYGDLSAIIVKSLPIWVQYRRTPKMSIALMEEWEEKIEKMALECMKEDVSVLSGVPSWTLVLFKRILELSGKKTINEVWPNLSLYMHGGMDFSPYEEHFKSIVDSDKLVYAETYNATEGNFAFQDTLDASNGMLLLLDHGIFYEFLPLENYHDKSPNTLSLKEVEIGIHYVPVISTNSGLWRYTLDDTIKFISTKPYRIKVTGRTRHFINAFGEELIIENAENSIKVACSETGAIIKDYTVAPIYFDKKRSGSHEWLIEFNKAPSNINEFGLKLDSSLKNLNSDYEAKRYGDMIIKKPLIRSVPKNTFDRWLKGKNKLGGQSKIPRLYNDRRYVEEILDLAYENN